MTSIKPESVHETLSRWILADGFDIVFDAERSHDAFVFDKRTGREYLDLFSFFASQPVGFNHPKLKDPDFEAALRRNSRHRPTLSDVYTTDFAEFVDTFGRIAGRDYFKHFFFVEGGAMGIENALKVAFDWKVRKNLAAGKGEKGSQVIHFREAFHGRSGYTLSLTNTEDPNKHKYFPKFPWPRIPNPKLRFPVTDEVLSETRRVEAEAVKAIEKAVSDNPHDIAALIIEPIQAEGGDNHFRPEFLRELRRLADAHDFMLVFDEVQTGMGLTGRQWAFEHSGVVPDLIAFGKKTQIGGCAATGRVDEVKDNVFHVPSRLNSTWGGNALDMVRCKRFLEIIEEDGLVRNAADVGAYSLEKLKEWAATTKRVTNVRGCGLMMAFDLPDSDTRAALRKRIYENGAIILACGNRSLRLRPHLDFTKAHMDRAVEIFRKSEAQLG